MGIKHSFTSLKADGTDATVVRPSNWNSDHTVDSDVAFNGFGITHTSMWYTPEDFGAVGDGITDDTQAFKDLAAAVNNIAGTVYVKFGAMKNYLVWSTGVVPSQDRLLDFAGISSLTIDYNGSRIFTTAQSTDWVDNSYVILWQLCPNVTIIDPWYEQTVATALDFNHGAHHLSHFGDGVSNNALITGIRQFGGLSCYDVFLSGPQTTRTNAATILGARLENVFYGFNIQSSGDNFFARGIYTINCGRPYFPYSVSGHDVEIMVEDHGDIYTPLLMGVYTQGTESGFTNSMTNMRLKATFPQQTVVPADFSCLVFFIQNGGGANTAGYIRNIDIELVIYAYPSGTNELIGFSSSDELTESHVFENLTFRITALQATNGPVFKWDTSVWTNSTIRNLAFRDCSFTGLGLTPIVIDGTKISSNLLLENVYSDQNLTLTNLPAGVLNLVAVDTPNWQSASDNATSQGYHYMGNGTLQQWGISAGASVTFPIAFRAATTPNVVAAEEVTAVTNTGFTCSGANVNWIAMGRA